MVKGVEGIKAELRRHSLSDGNVLHERHVAVEEVRTKGCIAPNVPDLIQARVVDAGEDICRLSGPAGLFTARRAAS